MAKRLKLRICRAIASTMQSCRSKDPSTLPQNPIPTFQCTDPEFEWKKEQKWHVIAKIYQHNTPRLKMGTAPDFSPLPAPPYEAERKKRRLNKKKKKKKKKGISGAGEGEETERLVSSSKRRQRGASREAAGDGEIPARLSMLKKLIPCAVDGKVKESYAIVKKSEDPYEDFKDSMMDMILEKQIFEERDLEQLLQCFLSLNSRRYHGIIVEAFCEIWDSIFSSTDHIHRQ